MKCSLTDITETRKDLVVAFDAEEVQDEFQKLVSEFARQARIPGFRPGKAPLAMIERRFSREIREELKQKVVARAYKNGFEETKAKVAELISVNEGEIQPGQPTEIKFTFDITPEFNLPGYRGLELQEISTQATDEEVDAEIEELRRQAADFQPVERASQTGDYVKLSYEGTCEGQPVSALVPDRPIYGNMPQTWEEVGSTQSLLPGLGEQLAGLSAGEDRSIEVVFPQDFHQQPLAGKTAQYVIKALEVRQRVLPEIDEAFLKRQQADSLDSLKTAIRQRLTSLKERENRLQLRRQAMDKLREQSEFPLPQSLLDQEAEAVFRQIVEANLRQGVSSEELEKNRDAILGEARKAAIGRVQLNLILDRIAAEESIKVEQEDLTQAIMMRAMQTRQKPEKVAKELRQDRAAVQGLQQNILRDKTVDFVVNQGKILPVT